MSILAAIACLAGGVAIGVAFSVSIKADLAKVKADIASILAKLEAKV